MRNEVHTLDIPTVTALEEDCIRESPCHWPRHFVRLEDDKPEQIIEFDTISRSE